MDSETWRWKIRLFVSADLVGSTAFKATKSSELVPEWAPTFKEFFREFPTFVKVQYPALKSTCKHFSLCSQTLKPWKFLGDEILFHVEIKDHSEIPSHLCAFKKAISEFPAQWSAKGIPLRLKGAAWIAGFPVTNSEIEIDTEEGTKLDFIGPSIDLGFRLARFSDERKLIISADLALMLIDAIHRCDIPPKYFEILLHGRETLKGVIDNKPYPIVWLDLGDEDKDLEEMLLGVKRQSDHSKMRSYLTSFIEKNTPSMFRPFIDGDPDPKYAKVPENFVNLREKMIPEENDRGFLTDSPQDVSAEGPAKQPKAPIAPKRKVKKAT